MTISDAITTMSDILISEFERRGIQICNKCSEDKRCVSKCDNVKKMMCLGITFDMMKEEFEKDENLRNKLKEKMQMIDYID